MTISDEVRKRLLSLEKDGRLTPATVVEDAKDKSSPLHGLFEWDKGKAAYQHWLDTARTIIRSVRVTITNEKTVITSVAYVRDPEANANEQGYRSISGIRTEKELSEEVLRQEIRRAVAILKRIREIAEMLGIDADLSTDNLIELSEQLGD